MKAEKYDYSELLEKLRKIYHSYYLQNGLVYKNSDYQEENDECIIANVRFVNLYCIAYIMFDDSVNTTEKALTDKGVFNIFINTCLNEYKIYEEIATGNMQYIPSKLAKYIFYNAERREIVRDYLMSEKDNIARIGHKVFDVEKGKGL